MRVEIAKHAGYCYGVERALTLAKEAAESRSAPIRTLGPIIHNPQVVDSLREMGVRPVDSIDELEEGTIIIRTHGVDPEIVEKARSRGLTVVDATCPFVAKAQRRAASLKDEGYTVLIVGERNHPEVEGILAHVGGDARVVERVSDISNLKAKRVGIVVQTTQSIENLQRIVSLVIERSIDLKVYNTICNATSQRQVAARELAVRADAMVVIGGKNSANTTRLAQICHEKNSRTYHIETADELRSEWFKGCQMVGVTAGASTPNWILKEVEDRLSEM